MPAIYDRQGKLCYNEKELPEASQERLSIIACPYYAQNEPKDKDFLRIVFGNIISGRSLRLSPALVAVVWGKPYPH